MPSALKHLGSVLLLPLFGFAQQPSTTPSADTIRATSTLVVVPTRVQTQGADLVHTLGAEDFVLMDNNVSQTIHLEEHSQEPLAVVVLMQTGGTAPRQFQNYKGIGTMLEYALGQAKYRVSLVTYDSKPEDRWPFSSNADNLHAAFASPKAGDGGAATLDAVEYGLDWFEDQRPRGRRLILLIADEHFSHPAEQSQRIVRRLAETNTAIYTLNYSSDKQWLKDQFTHERHENPPYFFAPDHPPLLHTFDLLTPLMHAVGAMQKNSAVEMASLSGGVALPFGDRKQLEQQLTVFANDLANRYLLSFQPVASAPGLHSIQVSVPTHPEFRVSSRSGYWRDETAQRP
jgi:VWFA-related protein